MTQIHLYLSPFISTTVSGIVTRTIASVTKLGLNMTTLQRIFRPNSDVNYKWMSVLYVLGCAASIALYLVESNSVRPQSKSMADWNGTYVVFAPYFPCLLWLLCTMSIGRTFVANPTTTVEKDKDQ